MTLLNVSGHRPVAFDNPPPVVARITLRTVDGRYLHQDVATAKLVHGRTWAWKGNLPQMRRVLASLPAEIRRQLIPANLDGLPLSIRRRQ
jgi:hypothetical protein